MKLQYHKIRGVDKSVCTAEQKIAYNMASRILADTATAYHDENDSLLLSSYVDYLNSHFEAFACTSDTETLKLLALTNKAISNILYRALQIADENPTQLSL